MRRPSLTWSRNFAQVDTDNNGAITKEEFDAACGKDMVKNPQ
jgi:hypothetical protein